MEQRTYVRTLCMMLFTAVRKTIPESRLRIEHSISRGWLCHILDREGNIVEVLPETIDSLRGEMMRLHRERLSLLCEEMPRNEALARFAEEDMPDAVRLIESVDDDRVPVVTLDGVTDLCTGPVAENTAEVGVFNLRPYKDGFLLLPPDANDPKVSAQPLRQSKMYNAFVEHQRFNRVIGVTDVGELNNVVEDGRVSDLINVAEAMHFKLLGRIASDIVRRRREGGAGIVMMAGPSSSGKTTTGKRLGVQLMTELVRPKMISLDDYFVDRHRTPLDENGEYDYENLHALDLDLFQEHLKRLLRGEEVNLPTYSFEHGTRIDVPKPLKLEADEVLLVEGIHGLNPELTAAIDPDQIFKVYISALTTLHIDDHAWISTSDTRLLRRIVRDNKYRHTSPEETIARWPSVRRGEERWIFPFQENADATFNSSLIFEIGVMKRYAEPLLRAVPADSPQYEDAMRLADFLHWFRPIPDDKIPPTSLLREFLGGSSFHY